MDNLTLRDALVRQLSADEGRRNVAYKDSRGYLTIGVGRCIDPAVHGVGLRDIEINFMLQNDIDVVLKQLSDALPWFASLSDARKGVLANMAFQLGLGGLLGFHDTLSCIAAGDFSGASDKMKASKWYTQDPHRAQQLIDQLVSDQWVWERQ